MKTKTIKQTVTFYATPDKIYHLLMDQKLHEAFTGSKATISTKVNGKFDVFDGYCHGYNIELVRAKKIVQAWHFAEDGWPDDHYSICSFNFDADGNKTKLEFVQTEVPEHKVEELKNGWKEFYWEPIKTYLKDNRQL
jgi:activator of HSP90 ATPase